MCWSVVDSLDVAQTGLDHSMSGMSYKDFALINPLSLSAKVKDITSPYLTQGISINFAISPFNHTNLQ